nr:hypothetical protein [Propionibacterium sp.]
DQVRPGECDHCHTHRPRRSTVLVAHDDTGQLLQVGRSCLKDFLGHNTLPVLLTVDDVAGDLGRGGGSPAAWDTDTVLAYAWASVQAFGWTPTSSLDPRRPPTRDVVRVALAGGRGDADLRAALAPHLAEAVTQAPLIRQTLLAALTDPAGYQANLTAVLRGDTVEARHLGLAVSDPRPPTPPRRPPTGPSPRASRGGRRARRHRRGQGHLDRHRRHRTPR